MRWAATAEPIQFGIGDKEGSEWTLISMYMLPRLNRTSENHVCNEVSTEFLVYKGSLKLCISGTIEVSCLVVQALATYTAYKRFPQTTTVLQNSS